MNELFAIDPAAPRDMKDLRSMFNRFGLNAGQFIAKYPANWREILSVQLGCVGDIDRSRLNRILDLHRDALLDVECDFRITKSWLENATAQQLKRCGVNRVLACEPNSMGVETLSSFLWESEEKDASRGDHIPMTAEAYGKVAAPLFAHHTEIHLVDSYFQLRRGPTEAHRGKQSILREFLGVADRSARCESLFIHFKRVPYQSIQDQEHQIEKDLEDLIEGLRLTKVSVSFVIRDGMGHGRYLFGIKGGLQFDHGFDLMRATKNHVHWLSAGELAPIHDYYVAGLSPRSHHP
jgi:hypothetical protein